MCPRSNDVMDHREDRTDVVRLQKQQIHLVAGGRFGSGYNSTMEEFLNGSFALVFVSLLNETFYTRPLRLDRASFFGSWSQSWTTVSTYLAADIEDALLALPNKVVDQVSVDVRFQTTKGPKGNINKMILNFTMTGETVVGRQNLIAVDADTCLHPGCSPMLEGLNLVTFEGSGPTGSLKNITSWVQETQDADFNAYECGRRGQCNYKTGLCECFEGFTGPACSTLTALA